MNDKYQKFILGLSRMEANEQPERSQQNIVEDGGQNQQAVEGNNQLLDNLT